MLLDAILQVPLTLWELAREQAPWLEPIHVVVTAALLVSLFGVYRLLLIRRSTLPVYNPKRWYEITNMRSRADFDAKGPYWIDDWFSNNDKPIRFVVDSGYCTILPSSMGDEFRNMRQLCMYKFLGTDFHSHLPGFDGFKEVVQPRHLLTKIVTNQFQTLAPKFTPPLAAEARDSVADLFGQNKEWHKAHVYAQGLDLVTRTVAKILVGDELCRNKEWTDLAKTHAVTMAQQARQLRMWPSYLRRFAHYFSPLGATLRAQVRRHRQMLAPTLAQRKAEREAYAAKKESPPQYLDTIQWFDEAAKGEEYDRAGAQLAMDFAGIYATSDLLVDSLVNIARHQELIEPLREEIRTVLTQGGWTPASLYKMKLLDSCLKESQRVKPVECATARSYALEDVTFSDGTFIPKGELVAVATDRMSNPAVWPEPRKFDPYRFMRMREDPAKATNALLENTNGDHLGFGWHPRACPGRFFASKEVKILLAFLLIQYDFKAIEGDEPQYFRHSFSVRIHPSTHLQVRRRDEDLLV